MAALGRRTRALELFGVFGQADWAPSTSPIPWDVPVPCDDLPACMQAILRDVRAHSVTTVQRAMLHYTTRKDPRQAVGVVRATVPSWRPGGLSISAVVLQRLPDLGGPVAWSLMRGALRHQAAWCCGGVQVQSCRAVLRALHEVGREVRHVVPPHSWWLLRAPGWVRRTLRRLTARWEDYSALSVLAAVAGEHGIDVYEQGVEVLAWAGMCAAGGWPLDEAARLALAIGSGIVPVARVDGQVLCVRHPGA